MGSLRRRLSRLLLALWVAGSASTCPAQAPRPPGLGVDVRPAQSRLAEESFQTQVVARALSALGYRVGAPLRTGYAEAHQAVASGEATFMADHWDPLHTPFFDAAGGERRLERVGTLTDNALQGYLIDRKTANTYDIHSLARLQAPEIARLFDQDGDGKADLAGCNPGWGCQRIIDHQLRSFALTDTVTHHAGPYDELMARNIARFRQKRPILYYTWTPNWVNDVLVPGRDVIWLTVPFSSQPGMEDRTGTALADGTDYGFQRNIIRIVVNRAFADAHPDAVRLFELIRLPARDISAQNLRQYHGESSDSDIQRHVSEWVDKHRLTWAGWLRQARAAVR